MVQETFPKVIAMVFLLLHAWIYVVECSAESQEGRFFPREQTAELGIKRVKADSPQQFTVYLIVMLVVVLVCQDFCL